MTRTTITMIILGQQISFEADVTHHEVQKEIDMFGPFSSIDEAVSMFGTEIPELSNILAKTPKTIPVKEKPVTTTPAKPESKPIKTLALNIILPGDLGKVGMSKEFLEETGTTRDAKLIRTDKEGNIVVYDITMMQLAGKCSQKVQQAVEAYIANKVKEIKATIPQPAKSEPKKEEKAPITGKIFNPSKDGKKKAEDTIISNLKERKVGNWGEFLGAEEKGQLIADLTQRSFSLTTANEIQLTTEKGTLFVHVPHNVYNSNREKWSEVIEAFRTACRKSRLEYSRPRDGKLPIVPRAVRKSESL
jgi:hypothetical protein